MIHFEDFEFEKRKKLCSNFVGGQILIVDSSLY